MFLLLPVSGLASFCFSLGIIVGHEIDRTPVAIGPAAATVLAFGVLLLVTPFYISAMRVTPPGYCHQCGYDLRGSQHSKTCPECGHIIKKTKTIKDNVVA